MDHFYQNIQGWFRGHNLIKAMIEAAPSDNPCTFVEVGCWKGQSTAFTGVEIINSGKPITLISVDTFKGSNEEAHITDPELDRLYEVFTNNTKPLQDAGLKHTTVCGDSVSVAKLANRLEHPIHFVYIDADHTYHAVCADIKAWWPLTTYIGGDDYDIPAVAAAVCDHACGVFVQVDNAGQWLLYTPEAVTDFPTKQPSRVYIGTPTHDCKVWTQYMDCMIGECEALTKAGIGYQLGRYDGDSFVSRCRDLMAAEFLANSHLTHLMWIDSDIAWPVGAVRNFVQADKPVLTAAYPKKTLPISFVLHTPTQEMNIIDKQFLEVQDAGTGFMCIRRDVFTSVRPYCSRLYVRNTGYWPHIPIQIRAAYEQNAYNYFSESLEDANFTVCGEPTVNRLTEDYAFCRKAIKAGHKILLSPLLPLAHFGSYVYDGDVAEHIEIRDGLTLRDAYNAKGSA